MPVRRAQQISKKWISLAPNRDKIMKLRKVLQILFVIVPLALLMAQTKTASAQNPTPSDDEVNRIAHQLYCPVCENTPLDVCPTEACRQWRDLIRQQLSQGQTEDQIKQYFVQQYGARVLAEPPRTGLNWLVYILPPAVILAGAIFLLRAMQAWTKPAAAGAKTIPLPGENESPSEKPIMDEYIKRLEEELKKRN
jgi:cytochrome c-type biogenesis protein CcmH